MSRVSPASSPTVGGLAGVATRAGFAKIPIGLLLPLVTATPGCRLYSIGLASDGSAGDFADLDASDSGGDRNLNLTVGAGSRCECVRGR